MNNMLNELKEYIDLKFGKDVLIIDVKNKTSEFDYVMVVTALNTAHIKALSENIEQKLAEMNMNLKQKEGRSTSWILLDYDDFIIHIFDKETREHYDIERLWNENI